MDLRRAVAKTRVYSAYFNFPLTPEEVHRWLISAVSVPQSKIQTLLPPLTPKEKRLRSQLKIRTHKKEIVAQKLAREVRHLPGLEMLAITGSVAVGNPQIYDDIDLLIVTKPHMLWLVRPIFLLILSHSFSRRHPGDNPSTFTDNTFCPNLWLDAKALSLPKNKRNIYTAHEVLQIKPLINRGHTYQKFLQANSWVSHYLANAYSELSLPLRSSRRLCSISVILAPLNILFFVLQYLYMLPKKTSEHVTLHSAYFHKTNLTSKIEAHLRSVEAVSNRHESSKSVFKPQSIKKNDII